MSRAAGGMRLPTVTVDNQGESGWPIIVSGVVFTDMHGFPALEAPFDPGIYALVRVVGGAEAEKVWWCGAYKQVSHLTQRGGCAAAFYDRGSSRHKTCGWRWLVRGAVADDE